MQLVSWVLLTTLFTFGCDRRSNGTSAAAPPIVPAAATPATQPQSDAEIAGSFKDSVALLMSHLHAHLDGRVINTRCKNTVTGLWETDTAAFTIAGTYEYDVKKTVSLISPYVGNLDFGYRALESVGAVTRDWRGDVSVILALQDGKWVITSVRGKHNLWRGDGFVGEPIASVQTPLEDFIRSEFNGSISDATVNDREAAWRIYSSSLEAEGRHDYESAIKKYEEIKKEFSKQFWPDDLGLRLDDARFLGTAAHSITREISWRSITPAQIDSVRYDDLEPDNSEVTPILSSLDTLDDRGKKRIEVFKQLLQNWAPASQPDLPQRVRDLLCLAALADLTRDEHVAAFPLVIFDKLKRDIPKPNLIKVVAWIVLIPKEGTVVSNAHDLGLKSDVDEAEVRERMIAYAKKLLFRLAKKEE